ncbi:MAG: hypothetical protein QOG63_2633 [Thermoleophilaceae bacterium]|nr:hypothetical protein [Thermoleophilaceae bacterium]
MGIAERIPVAAASPAPSVPRRGRPEAPTFAELALVHRAPLKAYCARLVGEDHAEDVVQQTLLKAWRALEKQTEVSDPRAWLFGIARNQAMDHLRAARRPWEPLADDREAPDSTERAVEVAERLGRVSAGIRGLPTRQRQALVMHALEGQSYDEIARSMGTGPGAVCQLITRARSRLRELPAVFAPTVLLRRAASAARNASWLGGGKVAVLVVAVGGGTVPLVAALHGHEARAGSGADAGRSGVLVGGARKPVAALANGPHDGEGRTRGHGAHRAPGRAKPARKDSPKRFDRKGSGATARPSVPSSTAPPQPRTPAGPASSPATAPSAGSPVPARLGAGSGAPPVSVDATVPPLPEVPSAVPHVHVPAPPVPALPPTALPPGAPPVKLP